MLTYNDITKLIDQGRTVDLLFFDFSKAFDTVCHGILLSKLHCIGIQGSLLNWIEAFLSNRSMRVKVADSFSESAPVTSGVPQGTVLGPLLFLIYINFAVSDLTCDYKIFADDIKIYFSLNSAGEINDADLQGFQTNIDSLITRSSSWGLEMNPGKCTVMRFSDKNSLLSYTGISPYKIKNVLINFSETHSDLGVVVDRSLKFHSHIRQKVAFVNNLTTNLFSSTISRDPDFLMNVYTMYIRPLIEYASPIWNLGYLTDNRLLERVQRRWTREVDGFSDVPYDERLERLDLFSVQGRLLRADLILLWKIFNNKCAISADQLFQPATVRETRGHQLKIFLPHSRLEIRRRFFSIRTVHYWNSLSNRTVCADSIHKFKALLKDDLGDALYKFD